MRMVRLMEQILGHINIPSMYKTTGSVFGEHDLTSVTVEIEQEYTVIQPTPAITRRIRYAGLAALREDRYQLRIIRSVSEYFDYFRCLNIETKIPK